MGCLKKIIKVLILSFAVIGFISVDGPDVVVEYYHKWFGEGKLMEKSQELGDFSRLNSEYEIDRSMNLFGYKGILAEHNASGQKLIVLDTKDKILTESDIKSSDLQEKLLSLIKRQRRNSMIPSEFMVTEQSSMLAFGKEVPYAKFKARVKKIPMGAMEGIISVVEFKDGDSRVLISVNQSGKYSQVISQEFFQNIRK